MLMFYQFKWDSNGFFFHINPLKTVSRYTRERLGVVFLSLELLRESIGVSLELAMLLRVLQMSNIGQ